MAYEASRRAAADQLPSVLRAEAAYLRIFGQSRAAQTEASALLAELAAAFADLLARLRAVQAALSADHIGTAPGANHDATEKDYAIDLAPHE